MWYKYDSTGHDVAGFFYNKTPVLINTGALKKEDGSMKINTYRYICAGILAVLAGMEIV